MELPTSPRRETVKTLKSVTLVVAATIAAVGLYMLTSATENTNKWLSANFSLWIAIVFGLIVALGVAVGYQLLRLIREHREHRFGARLKRRLVMMLALMALVPGMVVFTVSLQFLVSSIGTWFNSDVEGALKSGVTLSQVTLRNLQGDLIQKGQAIARELEGRESISPSLINDLREWSSVSAINVLTTQGQILVTSSASYNASIYPSVPSHEQIRQAIENGAYSMVDDEGTDDSNRTVRVLIPIRDSVFGEDSRLLLLSQPLPEAINENFRAVKTAYDQYQQVTEGRKGLEHRYIFALTLTLLLALLGAILLAFMLARRLAAPLRILAEGTQAVAHGDYSPRRALPARDELGVLTHSFNEMTRQLDDARELAEYRRAEVESARAYLENVLAHLSTGVLALTRDGVLRAANRGAMEILDDNLEGFENITFSEWPRHIQLRDAITSGFAENEHDWQAEIEVPQHANTPVSLLIHGSRLPDATGGGLVVVFEDISRLLEAQRTAAWAEVARRLAHEIKNPLTPIQLSAERLAFKLSDQLDEPARSMLERSTTTIVNQVEAVKNLVNAFRDYARMPLPKLAPVDLSQLVHEILVLYESSPVTIRAVIPGNLPKAFGDASQIRQIIHNMLQNAQDALEVSGNGEIVLEVGSEGDFALLSCFDNGPGFAPEVLQHAFEPYFTTKAKGTGLGLAMIKKIVTEHGGKVKIANREDGGALMRVQLRLASGGTETPGVETGGANDSSDESQSGNSGLPGVTSY